MDVDGAMNTEEEKQEGVLKKKLHKRRKKLLYKTVREQVEFYFSDANLARDRFLGKLIQDDPNVPLDVFMKCNKISPLVSSVEELANALKRSEILDVSLEKKTVCRVTPVKEKTNADECIIYVENVAPDATHAYISNLFSEYGKVVYVSLPKIPGTPLNKGFSFVEFDTPEEAAKALQAFWDKGCCLPTHMPPEKLCSIRTHESNIDSEDKAQPKLAANSTLDLPSDCSSVLSEPVQQNDGNNEVDSTEKSDTKSSEADSITTIPKEEAIPVEHSSETEVTKNSKKRKLKDQSVIGSSEPEGKKSKTVKPIEDKSNLDTDESTLPENGSSENKKRHRKKKKKTKEDSNEVFADGLLILSKKEWKRLRNKYLDMQKLKMKQVKARLYQAHAYYHKWKSDDNSRRNVDSVKHEQQEDAAAQDTGRVKYSPGVIVKVNFEKPLTCVATFKSEGKKQSCVEYVDAASGQWEAYLRCSTPSDAQTLVERQLWPQMQILEGVEENEYWEKIKRDRADKVSNKCSANRNKERGKKKLLRKAEKMRGTHLVFN